MSSGLKQVRLAKKKTWAPHLITIELDVTPPGFTAGQFFNLGIQTDDLVLRRSYSAASAPGQPLQFVVSEVPEGKFSPKVFALSEGQHLLLDDTPFGFFTLSEVPDAKTLWMVATGTGIGPYISMLRQGDALSRFERVIVVHGVRHESHLAYRDEIETLAAKCAQLTYIPTLSGAEEHAFSALPGRVTSAFKSGMLEERANAPFDQNAHMLLCGNPEMIGEMAALLKGRGFDKHRRRKPGHFNFEKYW